MPEISGDNIMAQDDIAEFADLWALMYSTMAREMVDSFGEE